SFGASSPGRRDRVPKNAVAAGAPHGKGSLLLCARNPLFRRISPLFRLQRRFSVNTLNLQGLWRQKLRRTRPVWRNPLFLPLLPANPAGWISPSARPSATRRALQTALVSQPAGPLVLPTPVPPPLPRLAPPAPAPYMSHHRHDGRLQPVVTGFSSFSDAHDRSCPRLAGRPFHPRERLGSRGHSRPPRPRRHPHDLVPQRRGRRSVRQVGHRPFPRAFDVQGHQRPP